MRQSSRRVKLFAGVLVAVALAAFLLLRRHGVPVTPNEDAVFTSARYVTGIAVAPDGAVWVGTLGGVLRLSPDGSERKFTRLDGLPAHEVRQIEADADGVRVRFPVGAAVYRQDRWQREPNAPPEETPLPGQTCATVWRGVRGVATPQGLNLWENGHWRAVPMPPSTGTHISALCPHGDTLWAALFGDGLYAFDGARWESVDLELPMAAREITALTTQGKTLWLGTRRSGVWEYRSGHWTQYLSRDEPIDHNCQFVTTFGGALFVSSLENGLAIRTTHGWGHAQFPQISSNAPRQMVAFRGKLYARHGDGHLDVFDGARWTCDVGKALPHKQASALAADARRLYVAQWGGWSEFDGTAWAHHFDLPELKGTPITALRPAGETLWIGTQGRGLLAFDRASGKLRRHDERSGLPDDWVTVLTPYGGKLAVGTFVGGLALWDGTRWTTRPELIGQNVTDLAPDDNGGLFIATRTGVRYLKRSGALVPLTAPFLEPEAQALCKVPGGLWIGTRTGLFFCTDATLPH